MTNERDIDTTLSEPGRERRERMRGDLISEMRRVHHGRRRRRNMLATSLIVLLVGGLWLVRIAPPHAPPGTAPQIVQSPQDEPQPTAITEMTADIRIKRVDVSAPSEVTRIETDETILDRYRASDVPLRHVTQLSDEQLVRELAAIGEPASVIRLPDRVLLVRSKPRDSRSR